MKPKLLLLALLLLGETGLLAAATHPDALSASVSISISGAAGSYAPVFSADGRFLVFLSHAQNLLPDAVPTAFLNIYSRDMQSGGMSLISAAMGSAGPNGISSSPSVSSNGQFIAFQSSASNLVPNDTNGFSDIFLRDTANGTTTLISVDAGGNGQGNGESIHPLISPDGRFVAFESSASNLVVGDTNRIMDVFVRDRVTGVTTWVSVGASGSPGSQYGSVARSEIRGLTPDGKRILFESTATNLVSNPLPGSSEVYVRDMETLTTLWVSAGASAYVPSPRRSFNAAISDGGHKVAYKCATEGAFTTSLIIYDLDAGTTQILSSDTFAESSPLLSSDGHLLVSENRPTNAPPEARAEVSLWDLTAGTNTLLIPTESPGAWPSNSFRPVWANHETRVAFFASQNSNPVPGKAQILVRDLITGAIQVPSFGGKAIVFDLNSGQVASLNNTGDLLAFDLADDLFPGDNNVDWDVLTFSWSTSSVDLISRHATNNPALTAGAFNMAGASSVSGDGRLVAWATTDTNGFFAAVSNGYPYRLAIWDTLLRKNVTGDLLGAIPVSATNFGSSPSGPLISADGTTLSYVAAIKAFTQSFPGDLFTLNFNTLSFARIRSQSAVVPLARPLNPSLSSNGRFTTYEIDTYEPPTDVPDNNGRMDVYLYDAQARTNITVSVNAPGTSTGNSDSTNSLISPNGRWVLFQGTATDLVNGISSYPVGSSQVFLRDLVSKVTKLLSFGANHAPMFGTPGSMAWSTNSQVAAFSGIYNFNGSGTIPLIMIYDALSGTNQIACSNCQNPSLDGTGRWVAYETIASPGYPSQVFVKDLLTGEPTLISHNVNFSGGGDASSATPRLSADARFVVFASKAEDLVLNDHNNQSDIFAHDRLLGTTTLLSLNQQGTASGNGASARPAISADGRTVVFQSFASDLAEGDYAEQRDVFIVKIGSADSDHDGIDDDWEVAYFGDLSRDGQGDFDGDGQTDLQEFRAGTDPTNQGSILRVLTLTRVPSGAVTVIWSSTPGKTYRVEYKDDLQTTTWTALPGLVTASSTSSGKEDRQPSSQRYYRVVATE
jgi:Tol biopolymer transport system component